MRVLVFILIMIPCLSFAQTADSEKKVTVKCHDIKGYGEHEHFAKQALAALELAVNSEEFREKVLNTRMWRKSCLSNQEIYDRILLAVEKQGPGGAENVIDLRIRTINAVDDHPRWLNKNCELNSRAGTIGIDGKGDGVTAICPQRLEKWAEEGKVEKLAGHYMHEYMHIIGFKHPWPFKSKSAVYKVGYLVEEVVAELASGAVAETK